MATTRTRSTAAPKTAPKATAPRTKRVAPTTIIDKLLSKGLLMKGSDPRLVVVCVSTGIAQLDEAMNGGVPLSRFMEIFGEWSAGKTLLAQIIAASFQHQKHVVALIDTELSFDAKWWEKTGCDPDTMLVSQPPGGEAAVDVAVALIGEVGLVILDSIAGLIPLATVEKDADESVMGRQAQLVARFYQKGLAKLVGSGTAILAINQLRQSFSAAYLDSLPGGRAQEFFSNTMLKLRRVDWIKEGDKRVGFKMLVHVQKSKLGEPHKEVVLPFMFDGTFDTATMVVADAIERGIIHQRNAWFRFPAILLAHEPLHAKPVPNEDGILNVMGRDHLNEEFGDDESLAKLEAVTYAEGSSVAEDEEEEPVRVHVRPAFE